MGSVFEAVHDVIKRRVAIKILHPDVGQSPETINRFLNEARAANLVNHPGLVQITDFGHLPDGSGYLVMEHLHGHTLAERLASSGGRLSPSDTVQIGIQISSALATAHKRGIIHRDLKPSNIMLVVDHAMPAGERVKVLDFGLAKLTAVHEAANVHTNSQAVMGTPLYMSPEQCEGAGHIDSKTDVYSLGCMLYELLSGKPPFSAVGSGQLIGMHLYMEPEPLLERSPEIPTRLAEFVDKLLVKRKELRPTMREVQRELESLAAELPPPSRQSESAKSAESDGALDPAKLADLAIAQTMGSGPDAKAETDPGEEVKPVAPNLIAGPMRDMAKQQGKPTSGPIIPLHGVVESTLGRGAAENVKQQHRRGIGLWVTSAALLVGTGVAFSVLSHRGAPQPAVRMPAEVQHAAVVEKRVKLRIVSHPDGAVLFKLPDESFFGKTPWSTEQPSQAGMLAVTMRAPGYRDQQVVLNLETGGEKEVTLVSMTPSSSESSVPELPRKHSKKTHKLVQSSPGPQGVPGVAPTTAATQPIDKTTIPAVPQPPNPPDPVAKPQVKRPVNNHAQLLPMDD